MRFTQMYHLTYRAVQKKKKMARLKVAGVWVKVEKKYLWLGAGLSVLGFFALIAFLWWLWTVRIPQLQGG